MLDIFIVFETFNIEIKRSKETKKLKVPFDDIIFREILLRFQKLVLPKNFKTKFELSIILLKRWT